MIYIGRNAMGDWAWMLKDIDGFLIASSSQEGGYRRFAWAMMAALRAFDRAEQEGDRILPGRPRFIELD